MSSVLVLLQLILFIIIILVEYKLKSLLIFLWGTLFILFGVPHFLEFIFHTTNYSKETLNSASLFVIIFNMIYLIIRLTISKSKKVIEIEETISNAKKASSNEKKFTYLLFLTFILSVSMLYISNFLYFGKILGISWGQYLNINKELGLFSPFKISLYLFFSSSGIGLIFYKYYNKKMYIVVLILMLMYSITTGNRITILPLLVSLIYPFLDKKNLALKSIIQLSIFALISVYVVYFLRLIRIYGGFSKMFEKNSIIDLNSQVIFMLLSGDGELALKNAFYFFIEHGNNFPNFMQGHTYLRILLMPIPTNLSFGLKPPDFTISMGSAYISNYSNTSYSMHPTLYGDLYGNFGLFGIIISILISLILILFSSWIISKKKFEITYYSIYVLACTMLIIAARGSVYNGLLYFIIGLIVIKTLHYISKFSLKGL